IGHLSWVVTAYLVTSTAATPLYGKLSDLYGRKRLFQAAILIFLAGSVLSGISQNMLELVAFRAVQGVGAGGLLALAMAITGDIVCLLLVTGWGGNAYPCGSAPIISTALAGVGLIVAFAWWEQHRASEPILPLGLFRNRVFSIANATTFFLAMTIFGAIIFLP